MLKKNADLAEDGSPKLTLTSIPLLVGPFEGGGAQRTKDFWQKSGKQIVNRGIEPLRRWWAVGRVWDF